MPVRQRLPHAGSDGQQRSQVLTGRKVADHIVRAERLALAGRRVLRVLEEDAQFTWSLSPTRIRAPARFDICAT